MGGSDEACERKISYSGVRTTRSAFGGLLQEVSLPVNGPDTADLGVFIQNRTGELQEVLRRAIEEHR